MDIREGPPPELLQCISDAPDGAMVRLELGSQVLHGAPLA